MHEQHDSVMTMPQTDLTQLVQRGMTGDRTVLPAIRQLLDTQPVLWREVESLAVRVEQAWMELLAGPDLVAQEILTRQLQTLKRELEGPEPTPLERLIIERIAVCWLQVQHADLVATRHGQQSETGMQQRQDRLQGRLLAAVKALAQVRKLLRPGPMVQVNIAQHVDVRP
jgi:hypothetical protein